MARRPAVLAACVLFACLVAPVSAPADLVVLKHGGKLEGEVTVHDDVVEVKTKNGVMKLKKDDILEIVPQKTPEAEYKERRERLAADDVDGHVVLADFCRTSGLIDEMGELLQRAAELAPADEKVVARWREFQKSYLRVPMTPQEERALASRFGPAFRTVRTSHWVLVYDVDDVLARGRVNTLEKVYQTFYVYFEKEKFDLHIPQTPLQAVLFRNEADYKAIAPANSSGVYIHDHQRLYLYNAESAEIVAKTRESLKIIESNIKFLRQRIMTSSDPRQIEADRKEVENQQRMQRQFTDQIRPFSSTGLFETMVHESIHQLCFQSGLLPVGDIPTWLAEGMAVYFEKYEQWGGPLGSPGLTQGDKLNDIRDGMKDGTLVPLRELLPIGISKGLLGYGKRAGLAYAQSWGLVYYLLHGRGTQYRKPFFAYLKGLQDRYREGKLEADLAGQFLADMQLDLPAFEKAWLDYLKNLR